MHRTQIRKGVQELMRFMDGGEHLEITLPARIYDSWRSIWDETIPWNAVADEVDMLNSAGDKRLPTVTVRRGS